MDMTEYTVGYLIITTKDMPLLVLGGEDDIEPIVDSDATYGMGPNGRSISGKLIRLNEKEIIFHIVPTLFDNRRSILTIK